ncbi:MAG: hypothetical protein KGL39_11220 [Patescibacteria group bacterium]|nr:hypothetical protein [Patescibacteria group bacterium]
MATISSASIVSNVLQKNGQQSATFKFVTDQGDEVIINQILASTDNAATVLANLEASVLAQLTSNELEWIESGLREGTNTFLTPWKYNTRASAIKFLLDKYNMAAYIVVLPFSPFLSLLTTTDLATYGMTSAQITDFQSRMATVESIASQITSYNNLVGA